VSFTLRLNYDKGQWDNLRTLVKERADVVADLTTFWQQLGPLLGQDIAKNFQAEGNEVEGPWRRISPSWIARKARRGLDRRILHMTGLLRRAASLPGAPGNIFLPTPKQLVWGVDGDMIRYAWIHNYGGVATHTSTGKNPRTVSVKFPPRPYMRLTVAFSDRILQLFTTWYRRKEKEIDAGSTYLVAPGQGTTFGNAQYIRQLGRG